jgi:hypothetical protein
MLKGCMYQLAIKILYFATYAILLSELIKTINVDMRYEAFMTNKCA